MTPSLSSHCVVTMSSRWLMNGVLLCKCRFVSWVIVVWDRHYICQKLLQHCRIAVKYCLNSVIKKTNIKTMKSRPVMTIVFVNSYLLGTALKVSPWWNSTKMKVPINTFDNKIHFQGNKYKLMSTQPFFRWIETKKTKPTKYQDSIWDTAGKKI